MRRRGRQLLRLRPSKPDMAGLALVAFASLAVVLGWRVASHATDAVGLAFLALAALLGLGRMFWGAGCAAVIGPLLLLPSFLPAPPTSPAAGCRFTVLSFNTKLSRASHEEQVASLLARHPADILLLQEVVRPDVLAAALRAQPVFSGYTMLVDPRRPEMVVSRFPLRPSPQVFGLHTALAEVGGRTLRLATGVGPKEFLDDTASTELAGIFDQILTRGEHPLVVGMDLNAGPRSHLMRDLTRELEDSHARAGSGLGFTFPTSERRIGMLGSWMRIDYILHDRRLRSLEAAVIGEAATSTHYPIRATLALPEGGTAGASC